MAGKWKFELFFKYFSCILILISFINLVHLFTRTYVYDSLTVVLLSFSPNLHNIGQVILGTSSGRRICITDYVISNSYSD